MWFQFYLVLMSFHKFTPWITFMHIECSEATKASFQEAAPILLFSQSETPSP